MADKFYCFYKRKGDWKVIDSVLVLISQYKAENKKVADSYEVKTDERAGIKEMIFKNPDPCFVGDIKLLHGVDVNQCLEK